ncbi:MAG: conjugal transfer protein TraN [Pseudomonadota bacterium]
MRRWVLLIGSAACLCGAGWALANPQNDARDEGEELAENVRDATSPSILASGSEAEVPGFGGTTFTESTLIDDPDGLTSAGETQRLQDSYQTIVDPYRPQFDPLTIDLSAPDAVADDPDAYLGTDLGLGGATGQCEPLPGGPGEPLMYLESCNEGSETYDEARSCRAPLVITVTGSLRHEHSCWQTLRIPSSDAAEGWCPEFHNDALDVGASCNFVRSDYVGIFCLQGTVDDCTEPEPTYVDVYSCDAPVPGWNAREVNTKRISSEALDESACQATTSNGSCALETETCIAPNETRIVDGLSVTRPCWEWERSYQCTAARPANDCGALDARSECNFSHDDCLSFDPDGTTCNVHDRWYQCTAPGGAAPSEDFICDGDLYCIDGECISVARQASTEFKDAMVAVQTMGELRDDFDPDNLTLFAGENLSCSKKLFGLSNCCSGKGIPLVTPFLCSAEDRLVDQKDDEGLCHKVGTYCSSKVLGICTAKKQSYCCFSSKLTRILQEQGRAQLGKPWGKPKTPDCTGFEVAEFQQLNLAAMDFSEVYEEFAAAARLPDEIETSMLIQQRIADYYHLHAGAP